jgi:hypothetical protein
MPTVCLPVPDRVGYRLIRRLGVPIDWQRGITAQERAFPKKTIASALKTAPILFLQGATICTNSMTLKPV